MFIKLTSSDADENPVWVNPALVNYISRESDHTEVELNDTRSVWVKETPEQILAMIGDSENGRIGVKDATKYLRYAIGKMEYLRLNGGLDSRMLAFLTREQVKLAMDVRAVESGIPRGDVLNELMGLQLVEQVLGGRDFVPWKK